MEKTVTAMTSPLRQAMQQHVLLLDGAMGSMVQQLNFEESDFRGPRFAQHDILLKGNNDVLSLTQPEAIAAIHRRYLEAGADVITTNTFGAQQITQREYGLETCVVEMNEQAARLARREVTAVMQQYPERQCYVVGSVGPTGKMLSMSDSVEDPASRALTFDDLEAAYLEQMTALLNGGVDAFLIETIFDTLNAKAALSAAHKAMEYVGRKVEILLSLTLSDASGRMLSGQTVEAFVTSVMHARPLSIGLNCSMGTEAMMPYLKRLSQCAPCMVTIHPNAGLPDAFGRYADTPAQMAEQLQKAVANGYVNMIGGCCGTTPSHIKAMREMLDAQEQAVFELRKPLDNTAALQLSGLESFGYGQQFVHVGERCNVAGSRKFLRLIKEKKYDEALEIAKRQVEDGAMVIDVNMDDGLLDAPEEMRTFLNLVAADPDVARVPLMIDSSRFDVIEAGLKCVQGKCIVNSISLKEGEAVFLERARTVRRMGAAVIVMCFDEKGQATTYEHRIDICQRAYRLLTEEVGFSPCDIIFDPNVLTVATGMHEHDAYALDFIRATEWIHKHLPGTGISGGLSNLSFAFRGNNYVREAMHTVFLYHAMQVGMNMAIMNPAASLAYEDIPQSLREAIEHVVFNRTEDAADNLVALASETLAQQKTGAAQLSHQKQDKNAGQMTLDERLVDALVHGRMTTFEADLTEALRTYESPLQIIAGPLMEGMNKVGQLFGEGKMFLPQVVKTARTMKCAVEWLQPHIEALQTDGASDDENHQIHRAGKVVLATVKGDVHDIGKNIVGVVLACNNFEVFDLGVMVTADRIVQAAKEHQADIVCLSGLITPSLDEMCQVVQAMQEAGLSIPVFVGGATTSPLHTAVKMAPLYCGPVFHVRDASQNPVLALQLLNPDSRETVLAEHRCAQEALRQSLSASKTPDTNSHKGEVSECVGPDKTCRCRKVDRQNIIEPPHVGVETYAPIPVSELLPYIDWKYFYWVWRVKVGSPEAVTLRKEAEALLNEWADDVRYAVRVRSGFFPAYATDHSIVINAAGNGDCCKTQEIIIETPRQKKNEAADEALALCDYIETDGKDYVGVFVATVAAYFVAQLEEMKQKGTDQYAIIMWQALGDRLVAAASDYLGDVWKKQCGWGGIRPAVGYPCLPEQKQIFRLDKLIDFSSVGISLTENGAMYPQSSVAAMAIAHPEARYFTV